MLGEGGEPKFNTNINFFLEEFGISLNADAVIRPSYYKYFHPKEAIIGGGIASDYIVKVLREADIRTNGEWDEIDGILKPEFAYPFGSTLNLMLPSIPLLTTGPVVYPYNRPVAGLYYNTASRGKILAVGSGQMFADRYILDESNMALFDAFLDILAARVDMGQIQFNDIEIFDSQIAPDTIYLAEQPKMCLVEAIDCDIPADFKKMFDLTMNALHNNHLRDIISTYEKLSVQYEPLKIIKPNFEIPLPSLQLAVFPPVFSDLPAPALELFDLDESFSTERVKLDQLTSKCLTAAQHKTAAPSEKELSYYIIECGRILGLNAANQQPGGGGKLPNAKEVLYQVGLRITNYKKLDRGEDVHV